MTSHGSLPITPEVEESRLTSVPTLVYGGSCLQGAGKGTGRKWDLGTLGKQGTTVPWKVSLRGDDGRGDVMSRGLLALALFAAIGVFALAVAAAPLKSH